MLGYHNVAHARVWHPFASESGEPRRQSLANHPTSWSAPASVSADNQMKGRRTLGLVGYRNPAPEFICAYIRHSHWVSCGSAASTNPSRNWGLAWLEPRTLPVRIWNAPSLNEKLRSLDEVFIVHRQSGYPQPLTILDTRVRICRFTSFSAN